MKIIFSGGGTLGPVTPLLAVAEVYAQKYLDTEFVWVGTKNGLEKEFVEKNQIRFVALTSGKWRRYFSIWNIFDIFLVVIGFFQSFFFLMKEKPDLLISAGGFVSVPLHWAGALLGIPQWIHQQDWQIGLANKLMAPFADTITVALKKNLPEFNQDKTVWLGNPVRSQILQGDKECAKKRFNIHSDLPVIFAMGGGTGSFRINQLVVESISHLQGVCEIIHLSGKERTQELVDHASKFFDFYHHYQFFTDEMADAYAIADVIISRGGFGSISEIAALSKPAILIPKPGHQYDNVKFIADEKAAIFVDERTADGNYLAKLIKELLADDIEKRRLGKKITNVMPIAKPEEITGTIDRLVGRVL
ncbi:MAG: UDP-N-acetylglucosamine--N-acetylmuramyl-(pentapeptide) pyrophosphoryl-undecaprenol N-acetylglucosamine transferase [Candidatus Magasanikbacteria bacterium]